MVLLVPDRTSFWTKSYRTYITTGRPDYNWIPTSVSRALPSAVELEAYLAGAGPTSPIREE